MPEHQLVEHQEQVIRNFLQIGLDQDKKLDELISRLNLRDFRETYRRLKDKPAFGYPFAPNCTKQYALFCDDNPLVYLAVPYPATGSDHQTSSGADE